MVQAGIQMDAQATGVMLQPLGILITHLDQGPPGSPEAPELYSEGPLCLPARRHHELCFNLIMTIIARGSDRSGQRA